ncbi:sensor histidine kinase [Notoacmeibacter sp. MSK16QG-6]|uniref:sensor histidine kinase n=1 Tax=Notoacmeibacter sp. MSK16QG-6 TaxID=2957982 RepID=UPI0020A05DD8|nr:sensor histidine kinase [Notoacmeibacter sp. MSK16QG-6]MCP1198120.1 sensor histidine kinase [Notoacmeibacter sp. MSK16QG-6]
MAWPKAERLPLPRSMTARVVILSSLLAILALLAIGSLVTAIYQRESRDSFDQLLIAHRYNLIAAVGLDGQGSLTGEPQFGDLRYEDTESGWYWEVSPVGGEPVADRSQLRSVQLDDKVAVPSAQSTPFNDLFERTYTEDAPDGRLVRVAEAELQLGDQRAPYRFRIMGNESAFRESVTAFQRQLFGWLALLGIVLVIINAAAIRFGLRPLDRVRLALQSVRSGETRRLVGEFPPEIGPLTAEVNALIDANHDIVERARTQVGNLAHSLKTPLSVLTNEADAIDEPHGRLIAEQAAAMRHQIDHYLQRARIAAQRAALGQRTELKPVTDRLVRVMRKIASDKTILSEVNDDLVFAGDRHDVEEMLGNLLENAAKWSRSTFRLSGHLAERNGRAVVILTVDDDGPGIPQDQAERAMKRGQRLDETVPGTGLGLSIVSDTATEYGGELQLSRADLGGLRAKLFLPAVPFSASRQR